LQMLNRFSPITLSLLRIVAGILFVQHGLQELFGWFGSVPAEPFSPFWFAGILETLLGPFLIVGLFTRLVALLLTGEMLAVYFIAHQPLGFWPIRNGGIVPLQFALIFLHLTAAGGGALALDRFGGRNALRGDWLGKFQPITLTVVRVGAARKLFGWFGGHAVGFGGRLWFAGIIEVVCAPLLALGIFTRPLAFLLSGEMATAFWTSHVPRGPGFWPIQNGGEPAVLFCFLYLYLVTAGPGWLGLDQLVFKRSSTS
jgi:putative oxidoreductase